MNGVCFSADSEFVVSCSVPQTAEDSLGLRLKKKVETENAMLFFFQMNPRYIEESWFNYQVLRDDGSVEMNCVIRLKDFVGVMPVEKLTPTTRGRDKHQDPWQTFPMFIGIPM